MPWHVAKSDECPTSRPWAVIKDSDGSIEGCHATKEEAEDQMAALYASEENARNFDFGVFGERERRLFPIEIEDVRDSRAGDGQFTIRGHAAVFDQWSLDLGGFREKIAKGAFDDVLSDNPDVWLLWDHDPRWTLARTTNKTLELRTDPRGLHYWGRVAPTSYASDLRVLLERGDIDQASFAFTVKRDEWKITGEDEDEKVERTILEVGELYDVTVTAMGAYPQTDSQMAAARAYAAAHGLEIPVAPTSADTESGESQDSLASSEHTAAQESPAASGPTPLEQLQRSAEERVAAERAEYDRLLKEITS